MTHSITQTLTVPVQGHYSVLVAGAGVAGVAAAIAAARQGAKVLLLEKSTVPGGLATLGLIAIYLPLCDGKGRKLIGGIAEELLRESIRYGYGNLPACWQDGSKTIQGGHERYQTVFNTSAFVLAMDALLERAGVEVL
ncbi:MAG: FAD-dependent oxidoreductase, partial [Clostridia bacterium]